MVRCSLCSRKFRLTFLALRRKESSSVRQNIRLPKKENIPRGKNDTMRSSEESHSHSFENEEFRQLCETKRKKRRIGIAKNDNAESRLQKLRYKHISGKRKNVVSLIELCSCKALDNVAYKAHTSSLR